MTSKPLAGQNALVTGASSGIGADCAVALARAGANIAINYHSDKEGAEQTAYQCQTEGVKTLLLQADVADIAQVDEMFERLLEGFGRLDVLVANAGLQLDAAFVDLEAEAWQKVLNVNLSGQFFCAQRAARIFIDQGVDPSLSQAAGKIVHMSSVHDRIPWPGHVNYAVSKAAIKMLMQTSAAELAPKRIRVNAIAPGAIKTDINKQVWADDASREKLLEIIPYGRLGEPDEIGRLCVWLCTDEADYITGTTMYIDGGMTLFPSFGDNG